MCQENERQYASSIGLMLGSSRGLILGSSIGLILGSSKGLIRGISAVCHSRPYFISR